MMKRVVRCFAEKCGGCVCVCEYLDIESIQERARRKSERARSGRE